MILLVTGADAVRVRERVQDFVDHFVQKYDQQRLNVEFFRDGTALSVVRDQLVAAPFLAEKRMVVLTGFLKDASKAELQEWQAIFAALPSSTIAVVAEVDVDSLEFAWMTSLPDAKAYPLAPLSEAERLSWLQERARRQGLQLAERAWRYFVQAVGSDITRADIELAKLGAFADGVVLDEKEVRRLVSPVVVDDGPFVFSNALSEGRSSIFVALQQERARGVADFLLLGTLLRAARLQGQIKAVLRQPMGDAAKELGLHPYVFKKESAVLGKKSLDSLLVRLRRGGDLDRLVKRGLPVDLAVDRYLADFLA
jgi:DNA polymerase III delta subunit